MSLESSLRECCAGLTSSRATDRKKTGDNLKTFLMGNAVPSLLSENTIHHKGYSWNDVFDDVNELVLKETEKYESSKTFDTVMGPLCENLLHLCVSGSKKGRAYISCDKIIESSLLILRDSRLAKAIGDAYLNLLYKHVLTSDHYLSHITPAAWEDLLDVCLSTCISKHSKLDDYTKLRLLLLVMKTSRNCYQFVIPFRDSLTKLKKCFHRMFADKKVQEVIIEIMILLLETLSTECRLSMCDFTENLLPPIMKLYDPSLDQKKKFSLFRFFAKTMTLHHPLGRNQKQTGSLASNWETWNNQLYNILEIVCLEVTFIQKQRKPQDNVLKRCNVFYELAASVYFQIFSLSERRQEEGENSTKKARTMFNKNNSFYDLIEELKQNHVPWLAIVHMYVKNYIESIAADDLILLLTVIETVIANKNDLNWDLLEDMVCLIVKKLKSRSTSSDEEHDVLISLWNTCVRTSTLLHASHAPSHSIMQLLLALDMLKYQNIQPLIKFYYEKGMPVTDSSVKTLNYILNKFFNKCSHMDGRNKCFAWLIQGQMTAVDVGNIKELILRLVVNENISFQNSTIIPECTNVYDVLFNSVERSIMFSELELDVEEPKVIQEKVQDHFQLNSEVSKDVKDYFETKLFEYINKLNSKAVDLLEYVKFLNIVLEFLDLMVKYDFINRAVIENEDIYRLLKKGIRDMYLSLTHNLKGSRITEQISLLKQLKNILIGGYAALLSSQIRTFDGEFFKCLNLLVNKRMTSDEEEMFEQDDCLSDAQTLRHLSICVLAAYCRTRADGRSEVLDFILDPKIYNFTSSWDVNCALECIELLNDCKVEEPPLESIFILMQGMCKDLFKYSEASFKLLRVFTKMLDQFWQLSNGKQNCCIMVRGYLQRCEKKYYSPHVAALIYDSAAKIAALSFKYNIEVDNMYLEAVQNKVKADIHSIRLYCCYLLKLNFRHVSDRDIASYLTSLLDIFVIKMAEKTESILKDESANRTTCLCNILVLCLPYIVAEKYSLSFEGGKREWAENAHRMFESTREILGADKWSTLFVENMSELVVLVGSHLSDRTAAQTQYNVHIPPLNKSFCYPKAVFQAILTYMGELIEENILNYHCEQQALTIFKTLIKLWSYVLDENVFEYKVLKLHSYICFLESVPFGYSSDAFVCNFACNSLANAIKGSKSKDDIRVYVDALKIILEKILPDQVDTVRKTVSHILSILMIKKEEGFEAVVDPLLNYLAVDMKPHLIKSEDVIDFITSLSQSAVGNLNCSSKTEFLEKLKTYRSSLSCPSHETLMTMCQFLKANKPYANKLCEDLNKKGFSDDCGRSEIHQIICSLSSALKTATDDKTIIEACNCLGEIGNYDLKTLVTVPPADTQRVTNIGPKQYFAIISMSSLAEILFDKDPVVTNAVAKMLKHLMQYREGKIALELEDVDKNILIPLSSPNSNTNAAFKINTTKFKAPCTQELWIPKTHETHCQWLIRITTALLEVLALPTNYLKSLHAVCVLKDDVCRKVLPPLVGLLLDCSSEEHITIVANQINAFFNHMWDKNFDERAGSSEGSENNRTAAVFSHDDKLIVQFMLDIVNFVRLQRSHYTPRPDRTVESLNYLRLDYEKVAWVATVADQSVVAIYYGELWAAAQNNGVPPSSPDATTQLPGGENVQRIFRKCFVSIGEMDAVDGCGTTHLTIEKEKRKHLIKTGQFADALLLHDIALSSGGDIDPTLQYGVVKSLHKSGMHHLALQYIKSLPENDDINDIKYDCLAFLGDWSEFVNTQELEEKSKQANDNIYSVIKAFRYSCLKDCVNVQSSHDFETKLTLPLNRAKLAVAKLCQNINMENCQSVYRVVSKLHLFSDIEDYFSVRCDNMPVTKLFDQWQVKNLPAFNDFKHLEALIAQRSLILEHAAKQYPSCLKDISSLQLQYAELSLSNERIQMAQRLLAVVKKVQNSQEVAFADSQISWAKGHKDIALSLLRNIMSNPPSNAELTAVSLRQYGLWMAETKCENGKDIIDKYLKKSLLALNNEGYKETRLKVFYDIAKFADAEYKQIVTYMNSSIFEKKVQCLENMKGAANTLRSTQHVQALSKDERKALNVSDKLGQIDEAEIASTRAEKETFVREAMRYYLLSLKLCDAHNLSVFRVISLWLDNPGIRLEDIDGGPSFEDLLHAVPSRKFITVLPQLVPRITNEKSYFDDNLKKLIKKCAMDHPHHTLPILFSLKNSDKDKMILNTSGTISGATQRSRAQEPRVTAAQDMVTELAREDSTLAAIIAQMEKMCDATISFANYVPRTKEMRQKIPAAEHIHRLGHLNAIPIPTVTIPVSVSCIYTHLPTIYSFENYFELVGGINCPKKITCRSSDGKSRILLIKGEDDLRQDAVMQQVFNIVNTLLENDPVTSRNKLLIRTYKVVPMSRRSGVLEWCEGTMPIGAYLTGAHTRYRSQDISPQAARSKLGSLHEQRRPNQEKLAVFLKILKQFRPVFHYFFTEHYLDPVTWYERRLAYTKSVASSSMVGYILGLGDRHVQNILIDKKTAEVVHIDFGIAFDQGRTLPTPETIPFRLTQDIIAGFGSSGVEGIFRRSCEKTMQLLRDNQETLLTILEVLLCDPLYTWTVTSKQQNVLPTPSKDTTINQTSGSDGSLAKRALLSVSSKLSGTEGGVAGGVAVPGQVARLIHSATDPANLSRLYPGWQPYL
ncbi:serine-protein kinase ATM isoform X2 [Pectinophora gossypiella]|uniref:serine-protein kinase ATM isoform X2 n=1 Tax=Pectinophora gossypiella TaxID=13191 RepID=UPI00214EBCB9|nr:serine-protein kinase ATM isoform X2 [Pectinophora gossypiella]